MKKSKYVILGILIVIIVAILILIFSNPVKYSVYDFVAEGGIKTKLEIKDLAVENIEGYLKDKYGFEDVKFKEIVVVPEKEFTSMISYKIVYSGWTYATVKTDDKKIITVASYTDYLDNNNEQSRVLNFDNYQAEEIEADISKYIEEVVGEKAYHQDIDFGVAYPTYGTLLVDVDTEKLLDVKYNGDIEEIISNSDISPKVYSYYLNAESMNIEDKYKEFFESNRINIRLLNFSSEEVLNECRNSDKTLDTFYPYIIDSYVKHMPMEEDEDTYYKTNLKETNEGIKHGILYSTKEIVDVESYIVTNPVVTFEEKYMHWYKEWLETVPESEKRNVKRVTDYFMVNTTEDVYLPTRLIENFDPEKRYEICTYYIEERRYANPYEARMVNNEYIYERPIDSEGIWFVVEVEE